MSKLLPITIGEAFLPLLHNTDPFVLIESPRGCLKTCTILNIMMMRAYQWPGKRWYIWRSARSLLSTTVLPSFEEYVLPSWERVRGMRLLNPAARPTQRSEYVFENGSVFLPVGLDDILRGTSAEGAGGYLAEAIELERIEQATALAGMMRQPGVPFHQIIVDVNPGHPRHWTNVVAEDVASNLRQVKTRADYDRLQEYNRRPAKEPLKRWKRILARHADNPHYFDAEKWQFTEAGNAYVNGVLGVIQGHLRRRWLDGEWVAAEGSVYPEFNTDRHVVKPFEVPTDWPMYVGWDPGFDHVTAILWFAVAPDGQIFIVDEIYEGGKDVKAHCEEVRRRGVGRNVRRYFGDPQEFFSDRAQGRSCAHQAADQGFTFWRWPPTGKNSQGMVDAVRDLLLRDRLKVFESCRNTIMEFQSWRYKRTAQGQIPDGDDAFENRNNDAMDVVKGVVASGCLRFASPSAAVVVGE